MSKLIKIQDELARALAMSLGGGAGEAEDKGKGKEKEKEEEQPAEEKGIQPIHFLSASPH
jgi:hypothetical protein